MNTYELEARGFFGHRFYYTVKASNKAEAVEKGKQLLEQEGEWRGGNVESRNHGGMHVVKKVQK